MRPRRPVSDEPTEGTVAHCGPVPLAMAGPATTCSTARFWSKGSHARKSHPSNVTGIPEWADDGQACRAMRCGLAPHAYKLQKLEAVGWWWWWWLLRVIYLRVRILGTRTGHVISISSQSSIGHRGLPSCLDLPTDHHLNSLLYPRPNQRPSMAAGVGHARDQRVTSWLPLTSTLQSCHKLLIITNLNGMSVKHSHCRKR